MRRHELLSRGIGKQRRSSTRFGRSEGEIMASVEKALLIAARAHEGQKDKDGQPYILI
jgi:(p)ppGpp synthase/HD superfamily hydrolase